MSGRFCGHTDAPLSRAGMEQLPALAGQIAPWRPKKIYSSDLQRAVATADAISIAAGVSVAQDTRLREIHFGTWESLTWDEISALDPENAKLWAERFPHATPPGGEPYQAFLNRVRNAVLPLIESSQDTVALVTHAGVIRAVLEHICNVPVTDSWQWTKNYGSWIAIHPDRSILTRSPSATLEEARLSQHPAPGEQP